MDFGAAQTRVTPGQHRETLRVLVVAYVFPPIAYAGSYRTLRLCKYLARAGHDVSVITIEMQKDIDNDPQLLDTVDKSIPVFRTKTLDFWRWYRRIRPRLLASPAHKAIALLLGKLAVALNIPDHMWLWAPFAVSRGYRLMRRKAIQTVYTTSPPHSEHLIGYFLKRRTGARWVADPRDPILDNQAAGNWGPVERAINTRLERLILRHADAVITNTKYAAARLRERYAHPRIYTVYNSFDTDDFAGLSGDKRDRFTLAHVGSLYGLRKADPVLDALKILHERGVITPPTFRLLFVGLDDAQTAKAVRERGLDSYVEIRSFVPHREALRIMAGSHLLLLIKGTGPGTSSQIPGKLFEYLGTGNRILYTGPRDSEVTDILEHASAGVGVDGDALALADAIAQEITTSRNLAAPSAAARRDALAQYSSVAMAQQIADIIKATDSTGRFVQYAAQSAGGRA